MATDQGFIDYVCDQAQLGSALTFRKMFGEYALYVEGRVVAFACDNMLFLKPNEAARSLLNREPDASPYPNAKPHFRIDDALDDPPLLRRLLRESAALMPAPKPRVGKAAKAAKPSAKKAAKAPAPRGSR